MDSTCQRSVCTHRRTAAVGWSITSTKSWSGFTFSYVTPMSASACLHPSRNTVCDQCRVIPPGHEITEISSDLEQKQNKQPISLLQVNGTVVVFLYFPHENSTPLSCDLFCNSHGCCCFIFNGGILLLHLILFWPAPPYKLLSIICHAFMHWGLPFFYSVSWDFESILLSIILGTLATLLRSNGFFTHLKLF